MPESCAMVMFSSFSALFAAPVPSPSTFHFYQWEVLSGKSLQPIQFNLSDPMQLACGTGVEQLGITMCDGFWSTCMVKARRSSYHKLVLLLVDLLLLADALCFVHAHEKRELSNSSAATRSDRGENLLSSSVAKSLYWAYRKWEREWCRCHRWRLQPT